jgi:hypothetical protein
MCIISELRLFVELIIVRLMSINFKSEKTFIETLKINTSNWVNPLRFNYLKQEDAKSFRILSVKKQEF